MTNAQFRELAKKHPPSPEWYAEEFPLGEAKPDPTICPCCGSSLLKGKIMFERFTNAHAIKVSQVLTDSKIQAVAATDPTLWPKIIQLATLLAAIIPGPVGALVQAILALLPHAVPPVTPAA